MSKSTVQLKEAIQGLNIKKPFDLRAQMKPALKAPAQVELAQKEETQADQPEVVAIPVPQGFFMLAHSVFSQPLIRDLSGDAFRIFIWMSSQAWRFRQSNGQFRAAVDYIAASCGCSRSTVTRGLSDLKATKLIQCIEQNFKKGNLWLVSQIADGRNEQAEYELAQNSAEAGSKSGSSLPKKTQEAAQKEQHLINSLKNKNNSQEAEAFQNELKMIWEKFRCEFPDAGKQELELEKLLTGLPFGRTNAFARDLAVLKWWEAQIPRS